MPTPSPKNSPAELQPVDLVPMYAGFERWRAVQVEEAFPATVRGIDATGERFEVKTVLDNLSAHGLYLRLARPIDQGARLFIWVRLSLSEIDCRYVSRSSSR